MVGQPTVAATPSVVRSPSRSPPVNDAPVANAQSVTTNEDTAQPITLSATDIDSTSLTFSIVSGPSQGSLSTIGAPSCTPSGSGSSCTASVTYTPAANYNGSDSFTFKANDGILDSNPATVSITANAVNDAPILTLPGPQTIDEGATLTFQVSATDPEIPAETLTFSAINLPPGATFVQDTANNTGTFSWTPNSAQGGPNPLFVEFQ